MPTPPSSRPAFGRRTAAAAAPPLASPPASAPAHALSEQAQRFRAELSQAPVAATDGFADWRRGRSGARLAAWLAALALLSPGVICFVMHAPGVVSTLVEGTGMAANAWLRRQRRRHLAAITAWAPQAD